MDWSMKRMTFWAGIYRLARKKYQKAHMARQKIDLKCPRCREWFSVSGIDHKHRHIEPPPAWGSHVVCGLCGEDSYWNLEAAPVPLRADSRGNPIQEHPHDND